MENRASELLHITQLYSAEYPGEAPAVFSFERCCYFLCSFLLAGVAAVGAVAVLVVFVLKPRKPVFSLQALRLNSFTVNSTSASAVYISSVVSLAFIAENPNKVGIKYSASELYLLYKALPVGVACVPEFYQPAHSRNVSVQAQVVIQDVSLAKVTSGLDQMMGSPVMEVQMAGDVKARLCFMHLTLPVVKVAVDCQIDVDYRDVLGKGIGVSKLDEALWSHFPFSSPTCSLALYI